MTKPETRFDAETHTYFIDNRPVPSVTQVINDVLPGWSGTEYDMNVGRVVHACAAMIAQGKSFNLDLSNQTPEDREKIEGKVSAVRKFFADVQPVVRFVERTVFSMRYRFAGTCDLVADLDTYCKGTSAPVLWDYKGTLDKRVKYQLGGYSLLLQDGILKVDSGIGVQLNADGTYKMSKEVYDLRRARNEFMALLTTYNVRKAVGISNKEGRK